MITAILSKFATPTIIGIVIGIAGILGLQHLQPTPEVKVECPEPICNCDCPDPINAIDFDKVKNFRGNLTVNQNYTFKAQGDTLALKQIISDLHKELESLRVVRCK